MAQSSDIRFCLSGGRDNTDPARSLGGPRSAFVAAELFGDIDPDRAATGVVDHRCIYVVVTTDAPVEYPRVWFTSVPQRSVIEVGIAPAGKNGEAQLIDPGESPMGVVFYRPDDYLTGLTLPGDAYRAGDSIALWLRRSSPSDAQSGRESFNLRVRGLTVEGAPA